MVDGVFFINHALSVNSLSVFNDDQRFQQTIETIKSIDKYCPSNKKYIFDSSPNVPRLEYLNALSDMGITILYTGQQEPVKSFSNSGMRSLAECISFGYFLQWFEKNRVDSKRIYKLSGRYQINENFVPNDDFYKDSFVFAKALDSWMSTEKQEHAKVNKLYRLRFWHMDSSCFNSFHNRLNLIFNDCLNFDIDIEHSYYKNLNTQKIIEVEKIGVCGHIAPNGEYINE
jgi:hypothetical protein